MNAEQVRAECCAAMFLAWVQVIAIPVVLFFVFVIGFASASLSTALLVVIVFA
jgi:hypothetical protein